MIYILLDSRNTHERNIILNMVLVLNFGSMGQQEVTVTMFRHIKCIHNLNFH